jgi:uncharacterized protein YndB with AHSA1/START domain
MVDRTRAAACLCILGALLAACTTTRRHPMSDVEHVTVTIARPPAEVYAFASDPRNLPRWAAGLARSEVRQDGADWIADAPFGRVRVRFA